MNKAIPDFYSQALQTKEIRPMAQPEIEVVELPQNADDDTKLKFTATVERRPDFELPDLDCMTIDFLASGVEVRLELFLVDGDGELGLGRL